MDEQEYRIKAKLNEYHLKALEHKALEAKKPFCRELFRQDVQNAYMRRDKLKGQNLAVGGLFSLLALGSMKSLVILPGAFYLGYKLTDIAHDHLSVPRTK